MVSQRRTRHEFRAVRAGRAGAPSSRCLTAPGLSNREIAARLFLSHRTVGYHLYKAYPKLDVSARSQLAALIPGQGPAGRG
jgi:hypothetical protein